MNARSSSWYENTYMNNLKQMGRLFKEIWKEENILEWGENLSLLQPEDFDIGCSTLNIQFLGIFSYLETLFCLKVVYDTKNDSAREIINITNGDKKFFRKFINSYVLNEKNSFYKDNKQDFKYITARKIKDLRNNLSHFFSVSDWIIILPDSMIEKWRIMQSFLEKQESLTWFLCPNSFLSLVSGANMLIIEEWIHDCEINNTDYLERIDYVIRVVEERASESIKDEHINITK